MPCTDSVVKEVSLLSERRGDFMRDARARAVKWDL